MQEESSRPRAPTSRTPAIKEQFQENWGGEMTPEELRLHPSVEKVLSNLPETARGARDQTHSAPARFLISGFCLCIPKTDLEVFSGTVAFLLPTRFWFLSDFNY